MSSDLETLNTKDGPRIAWIGLGKMGRAMSSNIIRKSGSFAKPMVLYNRSVFQAEAFSRTFAPGEIMLASSVQDAVEKADLIFVMVTADAACEEIAATASMIPGGMQGKLYVDCSTVAPETSLRISARITSAGGDFVAMPVQGTSDMAEASKLTCIPAGPKTAVAMLKPYLEGVMARSVIDLSDQPCGKAMTLKLLRNFLNLAMIESLSQAYIVAEKTGLDPEKLHEIVELQMPGPLAHFSAMMVNGDYCKVKTARSAFVDIDLALKDTKLMMDLASKCNARMDFAETGYHRYITVLEHARNNNIDGEILHTYGVARLEAGLPFENHTNGRSVLGG